MVDLPKRDGEVPSVKMKRFHWRRLAPKNALANDSIWKHMNIVPFDTKEFQLLFGVQAKKKKRRPSRTDGKAKALAKPTKISLLDSKREVNVGIFLTKFKLSAESIREAVEGIDLGLLTQDLLTGLIRILPSQDELKRLRAYKGDTENLTQPSLFQLVVGLMPDIKPRLERVLFICQVPELFVKLRHSLRLIGAALVAIQTSKELRELLHLVLSIGNVMNYNTRKGGAWGFDIHFLLSLPAVKSFDRKSSLLDFIVETIENHPRKLMPPPPPREKGRDIGGTRGRGSKTLRTKTCSKTNENPRLAVELKPVIPACRVDMDHLESQIAIIHKELDGIRESLLKQRQGESAGSFYLAMCSILVLIVLLLF